MIVNIVSLYGYFNYGNRLQSYAVQHVLQGMGCDTKVIYIQPWHRKLKSIIFQKVMSISLMNKLLQYPNGKLKVERTKAFLRYNQNIVTKRYSSVSMVQDADFFVLGSDQVWNPKRYDDIKKQLFFLTFTRPEKKICFSPSFGVNEIPEDWKDYYSKHLKTFPSLSVREHAGAAIIKELIGRDAEVLIDPTLMLDRTEWLKTAKKPKQVDTDHQYVLTYFLGDKQQRCLKDAEKYAAQINGNLYHLNDLSMPDLYKTGPSEFLYLFDNASLILTDSFHACIFSFLFQKPFLLYLREGEDNDMFSRMDTLLTTLDLKRKYIDSGLENDVFEHNYQVGYANLYKEREKVISFLRSSMSV